MTEYAIRAESLAKRYRIAASHQDTLRDAVMAGIRTGWRWPGRDSDRFDVWALKDVSLQVKHGEVLGVIGHNGAGKSTLLRILSRITEPTCGRAEVHGRVGALLEVGTGFHPELSGRENIFLNGAVLGMTRADIRYRFDEIVEFSGVATYLETPVKFYSTGMYMRLAFAVAAHLEPDVLVVDEVLAVGDAEFQKRCMTKMNATASEGRTVLFVSHNLPAVQQLCHRALLLDRGSIRYEGAVDVAVDVYANSNGRDSASVDLRNAVGRQPSMHPTITHIELSDQDGHVTDSVPCGEPLRVELGYVADKPIQSPVFALRIDSRLGVPIAHLSTEIMGGLPAVVPAVGKIVCTIPDVALVPGEYVLSLGCRSGVLQLDLVERAISFEVLARDYFGSGRMPISANGPMLLRAKWGFESMSAQT